jgi:hypothetical protein
MMEKKEQPEEEIIQNKGRVEKVDRPVSPCF